MGRTILDVDPLILRDRLHALFLCSQSVMNVAVEMLLKSHRFKIKLEIAGATNPGYSLFIKIANKLKVDYITPEIPEELRPFPLKWISDKSTANLRTWIPEMKDREGDYHILLPFYLRYHLDKLREREPNFPMPQIDNLYLLSRWEECFVYQVPLSITALKDLLSYERFPYLSIPSPLFSFIGTGFVEQRLFRLDDLSQLYLGFCSGPEKWNLVNGVEIEKHPYNMALRNKLSAMTLRSGNRRTPSYPVLVRHFTWDLEQLGLIIENASVLNMINKHLPKERADRIRNCLLFRLRGLSEDEIKGELGFGNQEEYYEWQVANRINIISKDYRDPYDAWQNACEFFEIEPNIEILDNVQISAATKDEPNASDSGPTGIQLPPITIARHSDGFASIVTSNGKSISLTGKQAHLISKLHEAYVNGTPELFQARLINEIYGEVKENRLQKLFGNNDAWNELIEKGRRKGLIRLKAIKPDNSD